MSATTETPDVIAERYAGLLSLALTETDDVDEAQLAVDLALSIDGRLLDAAFATEGTEYHGPHAPGPGWVSSGVGPRGGHIWKYQGAAKTPEQHKQLGQHHAKQGGEHRRAGNAEHAAAQFHAAKYHNEQSRVSQPEKGTAEWMVSEYIKTRPMSAKQLIKSLQGTQDSNSTMAALGKLLQSGLVKESVDRRGNVVYQASQGSASQAASQQAPSAAERFTKEPEKSILGVVDALTNPQGGPFARHGIVPIHVLRKQVGQQYGAQAASREVFDKLLMDMRWNRQLRVMSLGDPEGVTPEQLGQSIPGDNETFFYVEKVQDAPFSLDAQFSYDIFNRKAQGILNRALQEAHKLSATARLQLDKILKITDDAEMARGIVDFLAKYRLQLSGLLGATNLAALLEGALEVADKLPAIPPVGAVAPPPPSLPPDEAVKLFQKLDAMPVAEREAAIYELPADQQVYVRQAVVSGVAKPVELPDFKLPEPRSGSPEKIHFPTIEAGAQELMQKNVVTREVFDKLDAAARAKAFTVAGVDAVDTLEKIRDTIAENALEGASHETFREKVLEAVDKGTFLSDGHLENVFRTNIQAVFSDGQMMVLKHPFIRSGFPYAAYDAINDDRVRHNHLALEKHGIGGGNIYRISDPVFQTFRPPWDYMDRCSWSPMTVKHAAELGVKEAQKWLDTGVEPSPPAYVDMPPFQPPAGFRRAVEGMPLSIQLSMLSMMDWGGGSLMESLEMAPVPGDAKEPEPLAKMRKRRRKQRDFDGDCEEQYGSECPGVGWTLAGECRWVRETLAMAVSRMLAALKLNDPDASFGMVGDEWHGPKPPGSNWVEIAPGPKGGKRWKNTGQKTQAVEGGTQQKKALPEGGLQKPKKERLPGHDGAEMPGQRRPKKSEKKKLLIKRPTVDEAFRSIDRQMKPPTAEKLRGIAAMLSKMRVIDIKALKKQIGIRAGGIKAEMVQKVAHQATKVTTFREKMDRLARQNGIRPADLRATARQMRKHYNEGIDRINRARIETRKIFARTNKGQVLTMKHPAFNGGDWHALPKWDGIASSIASEFQDIMPGMGYQSDAVHAGDEQQYLFDLYAAGPQQRVGWEGGYTKALDYLLAMQPAQEEAPF